MAYIREELRVASWINLLIGIWLLLAPFTLGFSHLKPAMWNSIAVGVVMMIVAIVRALKPVGTVGLSWIHFILGLWLIFSPYVLGFSELAPATLSHVIFGVIVAALSAGSVIGPRHTSGPRN